MKLNSEVLDAEYETEVKRLYDEEIKSGEIRNFEMLMILAFKD